VLLTNKPTNQQTQQIAIQNKTLKYHTNKLRNTQRKLKSINSRASSLSTAAQLVDFIS